MVLYFVRHALKSHILFVKLLCPSALPENLLLGSARTASTFSLFRHAGTDSFVNTNCILVIVA